MNAKLSFPLFALFGITRGMAGIGAGLLLADRLGRKRRNKIGKILFGIGAASTVPLVFALVRPLRSRRATESAATREDRYGLNNVGVDSTQYAARMP